MRFSLPTNPHSTELAKLTIRLYDALRRAGVSARMVCSRTPSDYYGASRSKYLHIEDGNTIRVSDHNLPVNPRRSPDLDIVVRTPKGVAEAEARANDWIEQHYGSPQVQATAA